MQKPIVFSGIQPSGNLHIGNYLGAIKQFVELQKNTEAIFCVVDEHAITVPQNPEDLWVKTLEVAKLYLACGINPAKTVIFIQSHVPAHAELGWILNTITPLGELERMTQFKDKAGELKKSEGIPAGLLNYPTLMAADILLYQTDEVPVGEDQLQHIELTRSLAERFNNHFGQTFKIPKAKVDKNTARIMGLDNPEKKMSKSAESEYNYIAILDEPEKIREKVKKSVTDSGSEVASRPDKPAISNLISIYSGFSGESAQDIKDKYADRPGYAEFKKDLAEVIISGLSPIQKKFKELSDEETLKILHEGAEKAKEISSPTLQKVKQKIGFIA